MTTEDSIQAISSVRYTDPGDVSARYRIGQIEMPNYDNRVFGMANVAMKVNDAMGNSKGMDGIIKNFDIHEDYNNGGFCRFHGYNAPGSVSYYSIC